jgi:multimeric flavodoxin WrbA
MERNSVEVDVVRAIDHDIATGVWPDMTEHGWERDEWPEIFERVLAADILVLTTPIWLGEKSSVCTQVISPRTVNTPTTGVSPAASSPATRTARSTAR